MKRTLRLVNAPSRKWSMNEPWLGAKMSGPLRGTLSLEIDRARKNVNAHSVVRTRTASYTASGSRVRERSWKTSKNSGGRGSRCDSAVTAANCSERLSLAMIEPYPGAFAGLPAGPATGPLHGTPPVADERGPLIGPHAGLEARTLALSRGDVGLRPRTDADACQQRRAERRRLGDLGDGDRHVEEVGLKLHEPAVRGRATVCAQLAERLV